MRPAAILFDFDGVLLESEFEGNRILAELLTELGHHHTPAEANRHYTGIAGTDFIAAVRARIDDELAWGLGWGIQDDEYGRTLWHWGANNGFRNLCLADPRNGRGIVVLTNSGNGPRVYERVIASLTGHDHPAFLRA